jgi:hypothetical protein
MLEKRLADMEVAQSRPSIRTVKVGNLEWQADVPDEEFTWGEAKAYAASLGDGWRLPTVRELLSLVDYETHNPACSVFPDCPSEWFWSSSPVSGNTAYAWRVNFYNGYTNSNGVSNAYRVRCVRSLDNPPDSE